MSTLRVLLTGIPHRLGQYSLWPMIYSRPGKISPQLCEGLVTGEKMIIRHMDRGQIFDFAFSFFIHTKPAGADMSAASGRERPV